MTKIELCKKIKKTIRQIIVDDGSRILSAGTGVVIDKNGMILTARHVVEGDYGPFVGIIKVHGSHTSESEYQLVVSGLNLKIDGLNSLKIDLSILKPIKSLPTPCDYMPLSFTLAEEGTDVVIAGYPNDIDLPFHVMRELDDTSVGTKKLQAAWNHRFKYFFRLPMMKTGIVGLSTLLNFDECNVEKMDIPNLRTVSFHGACYWIDTSLSYGGSGGPIVNMSGEVLGIICEKAFTEEKINGLNILPSGTGLGFSHQLISWIFPYLNL
jgi:hypothetical protein